jgi:lipopolysaccharide/colanic/teichoic acid biosynthesis glycosyltransferase
LYILNFNKLTKPENIRSKRLFDLFLGLIILGLSPVLIFLFKNKSNLIKNLIDIVLAKKSFVGFYKSKHNTNYSLPNIKPGVLSPYYHSKIKTEELLERLNLTYAKNYSLILDIQIIFKNWRLLDQ